MLQKKFKHKNPFNFTDIFKFRINLKKFVGKKKKNYINFFDWLCAVFDCKLMKNDEE